MVDLVEQLREVKTRQFHPDSLQTMILWAADEIERLRAVLESLTKDPPATLSREPDADAEVIIKMRAIAREALNIHKRGDSDG